MFIHSVYFWLKRDLSDTQRAQFFGGLKAMADIPSVRSFVLGAPADTDRPVIDRTYSCAIIVTFDDRAAHDAYQDHPIHDDFRALHDLWERIQIYDLAV